MDILSVKEVAQQLKVSPRYVRKMIDKGRLKARKMGHDWVIQPADVEIYQATTVGRPKRS